MVMIITLYDNDYSITMSAFTALPFCHSALIFQGEFSPFHRRTTPRCEGAKPLTGKLDLNLGTLDFHPHQRDRAPRDRGQTGPVPPISSCPESYLDTGLPLAWVKVCGSGYAPGSPASMTRVEEPLF